MKQLVIVPGGTGMTRRGLERSNIKHIYSTPEQDVRLGEVRRSHFQVLRIQTRSLDR